MIRAVEARPTAVDACETILIGAIVRGELAKGQRLPPERALADELGVHRVTLRAAISRLVGMGLVTTHQGRGSYVEDWRQRGGLPLLAQLEPGPQRNAAFRDLLGLRRQLARAVLEKLQDGVAAEHCGAVTRAIDELEAVIRDADADDRDLAAADLDIVRALFDATESLVMQLCWTPLLQTLHELPDLRAAIFRDPAINLAGWRALERWLWDPDREGIAVILAAMESRDRSTLEAIGE